jgi:FAD dependent oxidoreductase
VELHHLTEYLSAKLRVYFLTSPKSGASSNPARPGYVNPTIPGQITPQPKTALAVHEQFFNACGADLLIAQLETTAGQWRPRSLMIGKKITSLATTEGTVNGNVFIDASYEGDVMYSAGVSYTIGRERSALYGESLAGSGTLGFSSFSKRFACLSRPNEETSPLLNRPPSGRS